MRRLLGTRCLRCDGTCADGAAGLACAVCWWVMSGGACAQIEVVKIHDAATASTSTVDIRPVVVFMPRPFVMSPVRRRTQL